MEINKENLGSEVELVNKYVVDAFTKDRRASRRLSYIKVALVSFFATVYLGMIFYGFAPKQAPQPNDHVAVIDIKGVIMSDKPASIEKLEPLLKRAFESEAVKGVILRINSPGGSPVQSDLINEAIYAYKGKNPGKPVIAVAEDTIASGAYFVAVAADEIVVNASSVVGSIGVISGGFGFYDLLQSVGVERRVYTAGESKSLGDPFLPETEDGIETRKEILEAVHKEFIDVVKRGRSDKLSKNDDLFSGKVWAGKKALELGLVDSLGSVRTVMDTKFDGLQAMLYQPQENMLKKLLGNFDTTNFISQVLSEVLNSDSKEVLLLKP